MPEHLGPKLFNFATEIAGDTVAQAKLTASTAFVHPHVSLMPDAHLGKGSAVGTVIPTKDAVIPAAVGVDIGCGMVAAKTRFTEQDLSARFGDYRTVTRAAAPGRRRDPAVARQLQQELAAVPVHRQEAQRAPAATEGPRRRSITQPKVDAAVGISRRWQPIRRTLSRHRRQRLAVPAQRLARRRQQDRPTAHQDRPATVLRRPRDQAAQPRSGVLQRGNGPSSSATSRIWSGHSA